MGFLSNLPEITGGIDLWVRRQSEMFVEDYRDLIWETFLRLLNQTPQWSGHAAANWNIGVGAPDVAVHDMYLKDDQRDSDYQSFVARVKGDRRAIQRATRRYGGRNGPWSKLVKRGTKVYFTNSVVGNDDTWSNDGTVFYLANLQNPSWHSRLRVENMPYETAQESIYFIYAKWSAKHGMAGRFGGANLGVDY